MAISIFSIMSQTSQLRLSDTSLCPPISSLAHTALAPMIGIGSVEWMDTLYVYCIRNCIDFETYSSICINLCYAVWSAVWLFILVSSIVFEHD
jgi:hypothetical protein